ncbi:MAG: sulfite exporter TauE/SafE family protein [Candidatus Helarchaeota archaeon]
MIGFEIYWISLIFLGISILGNLSGTAGGSIKVPILIFFGYVINAVPISIFTIPFLSIPTTIINIKRKNIDYRISAFIIIGSFCGTFIGILIYNLIMSIDILIYISLFTIFLIIVSIRILLIKENNEHDKCYELNIALKLKNIIIAIIIGFIAGVLSNLFGIGGGLIVVPLLVIIFYCDIKRSIGTSIFVMNFTAFFGIIQNLIIGYYDLDILFIIIILGITTIIGSVIASLISKKIKSKILKYIFILIVICIAIPLLWISYFNPVF